MHTAAILLIGALAVMGVLWCVTMLGVWLAQEIRYIKHARAAERERVAAAQKQYDDVLRAWCVEHHYPLEDQ